MTVGVAQSMSRVPRHESVGAISAAPLLLGTAVALALGVWLEPWAWMAVLAVTMYAGCKWLTWHGRRFTGTGLSLGYLLAWPGMDPQPFVVGRRVCDAVRLRPWLIALMKITLGVVLLWWVAPTFAATPWISGWIGMIAMVLMLHFGLFDVLALLWRSIGVNVQPIMRRPLMARSLGEFWGRRWNHGFNRLVHRHVFEPLHGRWGVGAAMFAVFFVSGLMHELVISVPALAGWGGPTLYFLIQGLGIAVQRSPAGRRLRLGQGVRGWLVTMAFLAAPLPMLFHRPFVVDVIVPLMRAVGVNV